MLGCLFLGSMTFAMAGGSDKKPVRMQEQFYYVDEDRYVCVMTNPKTNQEFHGTSQKQNYAELYARTNCQMRSRVGSCSGAVKCEFKTTQIRKRRYVRVSS